MSRQGALDAIAAHLAAVTDPAFPIVYRSEPLSIPAERVAGFWYQGDAGLVNTLADSSVAEKFMIRCYWRIQPAEQPRAALELELWNANRTIQARLKGDSTLADNCADLKLGDTETGFAELGGNVFRALSIPVVLWMYGVEVIAP